MYRSAGPLPAGALRLARCVDVQPAGRPRTLPASDNQDSNAGARCWSPIDPLQVHHPTSPFGHLPQPPVAEPASFRCQRPQQFAICPVILALPPVTHRGAIHPEKPCRTPLRQSTTLDTSMNRPMTHPRHHKFFPTRSLSAALSSIRSANSFFSRRFSSSGALSRRASETSSPPNFAFHL
jgi:hypothetical protein